MAIRRRTIWRIAGGVAGSIVAVESARRARQRHVGPTEARVFRWVNGRTDRAAVPLWILMQPGSFGAIVIATGIVARRRGVRHAGRVGIVGTMVWIMAKVVKRAVGRGRPDRYLDGVIVRGAPQRGLGYPSGHAAVVLTLALVLSTALGRRHRPPDLLLASAVVATTGAARMYVGAHLPLDVVGGYALGAGAGLAGSALLRRTGGATVR